MPQCTSVPRYASQIRDRDSTEMNSEKTRPAAIWAACQGIRSGDSVWVFLDKLSGAAQAVTCWKRLRGTFSRSQVMKRYTGVKVRVFHAFFCAGIANAALLFLPTLRALQPHHWGMAKTGLIRGDWEPTPTRSFCGFRAVDVS